MTPAEAAQKLACVMNEIEASGYILYPHPRPVEISIRTATQTPCLHPDHTVKVAGIRDQGDGKGWQAK